MHLSVLTVWNMVFVMCTSPLIRSKRTAEIIWGPRQEEMIPEPDLREIDLYSFQVSILPDRCVFLPLVLPRRWASALILNLSTPIQGLLKYEGKQKFGDAYRQWQKDAANFSIDGHYPVRELWDRAESCWSKILAHEGKSVLVVAHNAVNQALVATAIGICAVHIISVLWPNLSCFC